MRALRPGEGVLVEAGEYLPCDGVVLQGQGTVVPYVDAPALLAIEPGFSVGRFLERFPGRDGPLAQPWAEALKAADLPN